MERAQHVAEAEFRSDGLAVRGGAQRRALTVLRKSRLLEVNVVANRPLAAPIDQPGKLSFPLGHRLKVAITQQVSLLHPEPWRSAFKTGDIERVTLSRFEGYVLFNWLATCIPAVNFFTLELHPAKRTLTKSAVQLIDTVLRHLKLPFGNRLFRWFAVRQKDLQRRGLIVADAIDRQWSIGNGGIGAEVNPVVDVLRAAEVAHADHVGLAGQYVYFDRFCGIARLAIRIG